MLVFIVGKVPPRFLRVLENTDALLLLALPDAKTLLDNRYMPLPSIPTLLHRC